MEGRNYQAKIMTRFISLTGCGFQIVGHQVLNSSDRSRHKARTGGLRFSRRVVVCWDPFRFKEIPLRAFDNSNFPNTESATDIKFVLTKILTVVDGKLPMKMSVQLL